MAVPHAHLVTAEPKQSMVNTYDAVVVGAGPNGLSAAIWLARAGLEVVVLEGKSTIGGGTRTQELTLPGFRHDVCSAFHPLGVVSEAFSPLPLSEHGLEWIVPDIQLAHPMPDGSAAALWISLEETAAHMGPAAKQWRRIVSPLIDRWDAVSRDISRPLLRVPESPTALLGMWRAGLPASWLAKSMSDERVRALFAGVAAHAILPLSSASTSATGIVLGGLAHVKGWPLVRGGSASLTTALAAHFNELGGLILTDRPVERTADLPASRVVVFDTAPHTLASVYGSEVPRSMAKWISRYRHGAGAYKIDYALDEPIPWTAEECRRAGTVHVGGSFEEIASAELAVAKGDAPDRPFILVGQQSLFDDSRAPDDRQTAWVYAHVPHGFRGSMISQIESQIERFAPGFRDVILERHVTGPADYAAYNPNYVGGDIAAGAPTLRQLIARPHFTRTPYRTEMPGVYLCSASTPPGPGVHGMGGFNAAEVILADLADPDRPMRL